jgi:hypothetical protein
MLWNDEKIGKFIPNSGIISEQSYSSIKAEYQRLLGNKHNAVSEYDAIVNKWSDKKLKNISFLRLYTDISVPTYEIVFSIEIPSRERQLK